MIIYLKRGNDSEKERNNSAAQEPAILTQMGEQIRLARLRRHLSCTQVAEQVGISRMTLSKIEKGSPSVAIGSYVAVLYALNNMDADLLLIARDDELGR